MKLESIEINSKSVAELRLSDITQDVNLIALETNEFCLLGGIKNVQLFGGDLFVLDYTEPKIARFDQQGSFKNQVGRKGKGPGEYPGIISFSIDENLNRVLLSNYLNIMCYDLNGNFLGKIKHNKTYVEEIRYINDKIWLIGNKFNLKTASGSVVTRTIIYKVEEEVLCDSLIVQDAISEPNQAASHPGAFYLSDIDEGLFIYTPVLLYEDFLRDTLFKIDDTAVEPFVKFDFVVEDKMDNPREAISIINIYRSSRYFFVEYTSMRNNYFFVYDQLNKKSWNTQGGIDDDVYKTGNIKLRPLIEKDGLYYYTINASSMGNTFDGLDENDNPIVAIVKLKDLHFQ